MSTIHAPTVHSQPRGSESEAVGPPPPESLSLPPEYKQQRRNLTLDPNRQQEAYWSDWRVAESARYQRHVYLWGARLIRRKGLKRVLDVGCGVATKLEQLIVPTGASVVGLDQASAIRVCRDLGRSGEFHEVDLERPEIDPVPSFDLVICADVLEHLLDPRPAIALIREAMGPTSLALLSTPDRNRRRGRNCLASEKPEHVREWSRQEFCRFVAKCGLRARSSRLMPQDDASTRSALKGEVRYRLGLAERSPLACHALLCSPA
ncbi:MAG: class I SAM-dependent methyltransferase [Phycisphaeraceae bacterium]|nr:class I SAM-dependent methyltransferase [Phycisphaeraceae bacterium]